MSTPIDQVGLTAFIVAAWRAAASERAAPLISDHIAHLFLDPATAQLAQTVTDAAPLTQHLVCLRTRYLDDRLVEQLDGPARQVVLLGAGLDTRALRFARPGVRFFEIDRAPVLDFKAARLAQHGYGSPGTPVRADYVADDWWPMLLGAGFDPDLATFVIWEGNSMYIPQPAIIDLLRSLATRVRRLTLAFDYLSRRLLQRSAGQSSGLIASFAALEAPWVSGFDTIAPLARQIGLAIIDDSMLVRWGERLRPALPLDPRLLDDYFICTLGQGAHA